MENILEELSQIPGIIGSMIVGKDGLAIASAWDSDVDTDMVGALTAEVLNTTESMMSEKFNLGSTVMITVEAENARIFLKNIDEDTFLTVASDVESSLGLMRIETRKAAEKIKEVL